MSAREGRRADVREVLEIERASPEAPHWPDHEYEKILSGEHEGGPITRKLFVWVEAECLHGFAVAMVIDLGGDCIGELESVVVREAARRRGIGRALCQAVMGWCAVRGAQVVRLEVRASSAGPIALYEELGFRRTDLRKTYYRDPADDALLLEWKPDPSTNLNPEPAGLSSE